MTANEFLSRLDKVRETRPQQWLARCPAHEDRSPSLSIRQLEDGRVLIHDFGGCEAEDVLAAVGLTFAALYPGQPVSNRERKVRWLHPVDALRVVAHETAVVLIAAEDMASGRTLGDDERRRLHDAVRRIRGSYASLS